MHFTVYCLDHPGMLQRRLEHYDDHKAYLKTAPIATLISGPLLESDGETMIGSFFLYEADRIDVLRRFVDEDPFNQAGIWKTAEIRPFLKRVDTLSPPA
ncbi:YciI family protein [Caballeronia sp. S22]|uniref:YciI family protein n=1 Tax=Caballeronia sp. S22 TaxID=3137182 RepID=UPI0035312834